VQRAQKIFPQAVQCFRTSVIGSSQLWQLGCLGRGQGQGQAQGHMARCGVGVEVSKDRLGRLFKCSWPVAGPEANHSGIGVAAACCGRVATIAAENETHL